MKINKRLNKELSGVENFPFVLVTTEWIIIETISKEESVTIASLSKCCNTPTSSVYRHISCLVKRGLVLKLNSVYQLTDKGKNLLIKKEEYHLAKDFMRKETTPLRHLRFHNLSGCYNLVEPIPDFDRYLNKYLRIAVGRRKKSTGFKLTVDDAMVVVYSSNKIAVTFPDVVVNTIDESSEAKGYAKIGLMIDALAVRLEQLFSGLKIDSFYPFEMTSQHIAIKNSIYAQKYFQKTGGHLKGASIITDKSHGYFEFEATHPKTAGQDIAECILKESEVQDE